MPRAWTARRRASSGLVSRDLFARMLARLPGLEAQEVPASLVMVRSSSPLIERLDRIPNEFVDARPKLFLVHCEKEGEGKQAPDAFCDVPDDAASCDVRWSEVGVGDGAGDSTGEGRASADGAAF